MHGTDQGTQRDRRISLYLRGLRTSVSDSAPEGQRTTVTLLTPPTRVSTGYLGCIADPGGDLAHVREGRKVTHAAV